MRSTLPYPSVEDVTAVIPTRGDVDLAPVLDSLVFPRVLVWNNSQEPVDLGAYGRYQAIARAALTGPCYFQDDDCLVPAADQERLVAAYEPGVLTALMPRERVDYIDSVLVGWGSLFDADLPARAFQRWQDAGHLVDTDEFRRVGCDFVFPLLTPHRRLDSHHRDLPWAHAANRTWSTPDYHDLKADFMAKARAIRDAT